MTTLITITNSSEEGDGSHYVLVKGPTGEKTTLAPGDSHQLHVWKGVKVTVHEAGDNPPSKKRAADQQP